MTATFERDRMWVTWQNPPGVIGWVSAVNHRSVGVRMIATAFLFFLAGGIQALLMRTQLAQAEGDLLSAEQYNQIFTMHGTTMMFLFAVPVMEGFAVYLLPLMLGQRDMPFPRANAFGYWCFVFGGLFLYSSFLTGNAPDGGWFAYVPLTNDEFSPGINMDYWLLGITFVEISAITAAIEVVVGVMKFRAPGMSLNRMPLFAWYMLAVAFAIIFGFPPLIVGSVLLELDRAVDTTFFEVAGGGQPLLWQHLFWIFGHPEVYIIFLPAAGLVSMILPTFVRRPVWGYTLLALAAVSTAFLSFGLWVHHMFATGIPLLAATFFTAASFMIAIASGVQIFAWIGTIWSGSPVFRTPFMFILGFVIVFVIGGITGVMVAVVPFNWQTHDTFFIVGHFHYVLIGGMVFPLFAALYYWLPKMTGRMLDERLGQANFWLFFVGFNLTFLPMHISGLLGMPRRVYTYQSGLGWEPYNLASTVGAYVLALSVLVFVANFLWSRFYGREAGANPWEAGTLEWATSSPPPPYNFKAVPHVESREPLWDQDDVFARSDRTERYFSEPLGGQREVLTTDALDAVPDAVIDLPTPTLLPVLIAGSLAAFFTGILVGQYWISAVGAVAVVGFAAWWLWPSSTLTSRDLSDTRPGEPTGAAGPAPRATNWWGSALLLAVALALLGSLVFSYYYIWAASEDWPPDGIARPDLLAPAAALAALLAAAAMTYAGQYAAEHTRDRIFRVSYAGAFLLGVAYVALVALDWALVDFTPRTNAYGSSYFVLTAFAVLGVVVALFINAGIQARAAFGELREGRDPAIETCGLFMYFAALSGTVVFVVVYLTPYAGAVGEPVHL